MLTSRARILLSALLRDLPDRHHILTVHTDRTASTSVVLHTGGWDIEHPPVVERLSAVLAGGHGAAVILRSFTPRISHTLPDGTEIPVKVVRGWRAADHTLVPLDEVADGLELDGDDFVPAVWRNGVYDGRRLGIPLDVLTMGQYWNVPVLADAGVPGAIADGAEFGTTMAALQDAGIEHPFWVTPSWQMFASLLPQFGGRLFDETGTRAEIASPAAVAALEWMVEQISSGVSPAGATDPRPPLKNGSAAVLADLPATIPDLTLTAPDLEWGVAPFPRIGPEPGVFANSHHLVLTDQSQADEDVAHAAQTFVDWVSRHSEPWIASGNTPARATVRAGEAFRSSPQAALATEENFAAAVFLPQIPQSRVIAANSWQRAVGEAGRGGVDPTEALEFAQATAQEELDETNELLKS